MFWNVVFNEEKKVMKRWLMWAGIILISIIITLSMIGMANSNPYPELIQRQIVWPMVLVLYLRQFAANPIAAGFLLVVIASAATAQEYTWHTYNSYLSRGISRWQLVLAKFLALLLPTLLIVSIPMIVATVVSGYYTIHFNGSLDFSQVNYLQMGFSLLLGVFSLLPYGALAVLLSVIGRSLVLPMIGGLGWILVELFSWQFLNSLGETGKTIAQWLPIGACMGVLKSSSAIARNLLVGDAGVDTWDALQLLPPETAAAAIGGYVLFFIAISVFIFHRQDFRG